MAAKDVTAALAVLFGAFGNANDVNRIKIYARVLADLPPALVEKAVLKTLAEWRYSSVPPVGILLANAKSLNGSVDEGVRVKTWEEALGEIERGMYQSKEPKWSTPQIAATIKSYGWNNLIMSLAEDMPTVRAQLRRLYEDACSRIESAARNDYLLGKNPQGVLGIPAVADAVKMIGVAK